MTRSRLSEVFSRCSSEGHAALVTYLCAGDPDLEASFAHALACIEGGADVLEIGCPFSDPTADGEAIARASQRSIANGGGLVQALALARRIRAVSDVPLVLFGYFNPIFVHGETRTANEAAEAGVDALLVVDLPPEEDQDLRAAVERHGMGLVPLVAPTSTDARIDGLAATTPKAPFVYYVSVAGVTGSGRADLDDASRRAGDLRARIGSPCTVGFGVSDAAGAKKAAKHADGVVVGTAIVRTIEESVRSGASVTEQAERVRTLVRTLADAVHAPRGALHTEGPTSAA